MTRKPIIGLVGGVGSGKSTVASLFAEAGAAIIDSDALNQAQLQSAEVKKTLRSWWGESVFSPSGELNRRRIAEIIFGDSEQRRRLERFIHPRIARQRRKLIQAYLQNASVKAIVLDTPLLIETRLDEQCDAVVFVDADRDIRRKRVVENRGWSEEEWNRREKAQNALDRKRDKADYIVVNNSSNLDDLRSTACDLLKKLGLGDTQRQ